MARRAAAPAQPYKFLDYYGFEDRHIFFGRQRETEILLSDIITTRLVVLFAKTGTGKTSLINAGIRPRLEELDYATFYVRIERDPAESARKALRERELLPATLEEHSLATQLEHAVTQLDRPIVVFFDQFEEFFIYVFSQDPQKGQQFISDIARIYRNRESGVHIVFSMREEFFVEMDAFRDEIPSIFHADSNLRLRWFNKDQARDAIYGPAQRLGVEIEERLVDRLIRDLVEDRGIEPARLQIVCDTLWQHRTAGSMRLATYEKLGGAQQILDRRLGDDIDQNLDDRQLEIFERLMPELSTERGTKYVRGVNELVKALETDETSLHRMVDRLKDLRLIRESTHYGALYIEWTSDYLAERTDHLQERVRAMSLRRLLRASMERAEAKRAEVAKKYGPADTWIEAATEDDLKALYMAPLEFETISEGADLLGRSIGSAEARFLLLAALEHGAHTSLWFSKAADRNVQVWQILRERIERGDVQAKQAESAVRLLGELRSGEAIELLEVALQNPVSKSTTLEVLGEMKTEEAMDLLKRALQQETLASQAIDVLRRMRTGEAIELLGTSLRQGEALALRAGMALSRIAGGPTGRASSQASEVLADVLAVQAESLFLQALKHGLDMRFWFEKASENDVGVWKILKEKITRADVPIEEAENAVRLLGALGTGQALELLKIALQQETLAGLTVSILSRTETKEIIGFWESVLELEHLAPQAERALERISESRTAEARIKARARKVLDKWRQDQGRPVALSRVAHPVEADRLPAVGRGLREQDWEFLLRRIREGRCTPFVGGGVNAGILPSGTELALAWAREYQYPLEDATDLARVAQFLAVQYDPMFPKERALKRLAGVAPPDFTEPDEPHAVLAEFPLPVYITTNYDDFVEQALRSRGRRARLDLCQWNEYVKYEEPSISTQESRFDPTPADPLVFHLHGHYQVPRSLVLTENDHVDFLVNISRDPALLPPRIQRALAGASLLFIGYDPTEWNFRILLRGLIATTEASLRRISVVQVVPPAAIDVAESVQLQETRYLDSYFNTVNTRVYWGTTREFAAELRARWEGFSNGV